MYDFNKQITRLYTFRVKNMGEMSKEKMLETGYENPRHDHYFCYFFDEEITLGKFDIESIIETESKKPYSCSPPLGSVESIRGKAIIFI